MTSEPRQQPTDDQSTVQVSVDPVQFESEAHMRWWYAIRNADLTRHGCRSLKKISVDQHRQWWDECKQLIDTRRLYFLRRHHGDYQPQVVGIGRLDKRQGWTEVTLYVEQPWHRQGIGTKGCKGLVREVRALGWPAPGVVVNGARVDHLKFFTGAGFVMKRPGWVQLTLARGRR